jgi:hypothetical protein
VALLVAAGLVCILIWAAILKVRLHGAKQAARMR